ncbi:hypothetical protein [Nannocystis bainbridge]|uniref:Apple domain-containing protein n=1 Tax=Nannocystis bainbridge TaxID=2995303 RepID=A0ABT5DZZ6_9BACT|nr:hypothetical protein [Nannocystis bainbridge]MDC0719200.1 hypothetical protein [Nannocystis bainbridge]
MKTILTASLFAASLAYGQLPGRDSDLGPERDAGSEARLHAPEPARASAEAPQGNQPGSLCIMPGVSASVAKANPGTQYPLGGMRPPAVSCHDNKGKHAVGYHFKLYVGPGTDWPDAVCRVDYLHKPEELTSACWNACIEQKKACYAKFSGKKGKQQCDEQLIACKAVNDSKKHPAILQERSNSFCKQPAPPFPQPPALTVTPP